MEGSAHFKSGWSRPGPVKANHQIKALAEKRTSPSVPTTTGASSTAKARKSPKSRVGIPIIRKSPSPSPLGGSGEGGVLLTTRKSPVGPTPTGLSSDRRSPGVAGGPYRSSSGSGSKLLSSAGGHVDISRSAAMASGPSPFDLASGSGKVKRRPASGASRRTPSPSSAELAQIFKYGGIVSAGQAGQATMVSMSSVAAKRSDLPARKHKSMAPSSSGANATAAAIPASLATSGGRADKRSGTVASAVSASAPKHHRTGSGPGPGVASSNSAMTAKARSMSASAARGRTAAGGDTDEEEVYVLHTDNEDELLFDHEDYGDDLAYHTSDGEEEGGRHHRIHNPLHDGDYDDDDGDALKPPTARDLQFLGGPIEFLPAGHVPHPLWSQAMSNFKGAWHHGVGGGEDHDDSEGAILSGNMYWKPAPVTPAASSETTSHISSTLTNGVDAGTQCAFDDDDKVKLAAPTTVSRSGPFSVLKHVSKESGVDTNALDDGVNDGGGLPGDVSGGIGLDERGSRKVSPAEGGEVFEDGERIEYLDETGEEDTRHRAKSWDGVTSRYTESRLREAAGDLLSKGGDITLEAVEHLQLLLEAEKSRLLRQSKKGEHKKELRARYSALFEKADAATHVSGSSRHVGSSSMRHSSTRTALASGAGTGGSGSLIFTSEAPPVKMRTSVLRGAHEVTVDSKGRVVSEYEIEVDEELESISDSVSKDDEAPVDAGSVGGRTSPGSGTVTFETGARAPSSAMFNSAFKAQEVVAGLVAIPPVVPTRDVSVGTASKGSSTKVASKFAGTTKGKVTVAAGTNTASLSGSGGKAAGQAGPRSSSGVAGSPPVPFSGMSHPASPGGIAFRSTLKGGDIPKLMLTKPERRRPAPSSLKETPPSPEPSIDPSVALSDLSSPRSAFSATSAFSSHISHASEDSRSKAIGFMPAKSRR